MCLQRGYCVHSSGHAMVSPSFRDIVLQKRNMVRSYSKQEVLVASHNSVEQVLADTAFYIHSSTPWHNCREGGKTQAGGCRRLLGCLLNHSWATPRLRPRRNNFNINFTQLLCSMLIFGANSVDSAGVPSCHRCAAIF